MPGAAFQRARRTRNSIEIVLASLVRAGWLDRTDAALIARTQWLGDTHRRRRRNRPLSGHELTESAAAQRIYLIKPVLDLLLTPAYGPRARVSRPICEVKPGSQNQW